MTAPGPLTDLAPVTRSGSKGVVITQFDLEAVEAPGLVKIDLLGIRGLTVVGDVGEFIQAGQPECYATRLGVLDSIPQQDAPYHPTSANRQGRFRVHGCFFIQPGVERDAKGVW